MPESKGSPRRKAAGAGETVQLTSTEEREVRKRTGLRAAVVFESVRREGEVELERAPASLAFSGLAAGLSMGFSLVVTGLLRAYLPDAPWRVLVENFGYTIGFVIVVLGRQQLFTENTVTAILPLLDNPRKGETLVKVVRLWLVVLGANLLGALIFGYVIAHTSIFPAQVQAAFVQLARDTVAPGFWGVSDSRSIRRMADRAHGLAAAGCGHAKAMGRGHHYLRRRRGVVQPHRRRIGRSALRRRGGSDTRRCLPRHLSRAGLHRQLDRRHLAGCVAQLRPGCARVNCGDPRLP